MYKNLLQCWRKPTIAVGTSSVQPTNDEEDNAKNNEPTALPTEEHVMHNKTIHIHFPSGEECIIPADVITIRSLIDQQKISDYKKATSSPRFPIRRVGTCDELLLEEVMTEAGYCQDLGTKIEG